MINKMVVGVDSDDDMDSEKIFHSPSHLTFDNNFSGNHVMKYIGGLGYAATCTSRLDRFPEGCRKDCFHHEKQVENNHRQKCARFENPIVAVKYSENISKNELDYVQVHVSFQSTGSTNISTVNALKEVSLYVRAKSCGRDNQKRHYAIEMNKD